MGRSNTCCFTGHRPNKLPWGYNETDPRCIRAKEWISRQLQDAYEAGFRHFLCGMAEGGDLYFCEEVLALRQVHPDVTLEAAIPCPGQAERWSRAQQERYHRLLAQCDKTTLVSPVQDRSCMMRRNKYMVNNSFRLIALFDGTPGGTMNTMAYAMQQGLEIFRLDPAELK